MDDELSSCVGLCGWLRWICDGSGSGKACRCGQVVGVCRSEESSASAGKSRWLRSLK